MGGLPANAVDAFGALGELVGAARAPRRAVRVRRALLPFDTLEAVGRLFGVYALLEGVLVVLTGIRRTGYTGDCSSPKGRPASWQVKS